MMLKSNLFESLYINLELGLNTAVIVASSDYHPKIEYNFGFNVTDIQY
jgi:hypothetical protein